MRESCTRVALNLTGRGNVGFLVLLTLMIDSVLFPIFFAIVVLTALSQKFVLTNRRVIIQGIGMREVSIPLEAIEAVEVRSYGPRYGSIYLKWDNVEPQYLPVDLTIVADRGSIWLSTPLGSPPMVGLYGFKGFDRFSRKIVELATAHQSA